MKEQLITDLLFLQLIHISLSLRPGFKNIFFSHFFLDKDFFVLYFTIRMKVL